MLNTLRAALTGIGSLFLLLAPASAQEAPLTLDEATKGEPAVALWRTGDEDTTVYLMGTVHILKPGLDWETVEFRSAWKEADTVFFEADVVSPAAAQEAAPVMMSRGYFQDGRKFADLFTEKEIDAINDAIAQFGISVSTFANMRPWFASIQLTQLALNKAGGDPKAGIDIILSQRGAIEGKEMRYFETMAEQIEMIADVPDEVWARSLVDGLDEFDNVEAFFAEMVGYWYDGKADDLAALLAESWEETPDLKTTLLDNRNKLWAEDLDGVIDEVEGTVFVAVGAGHLAGDGSLQEYLAELGHEVERVNP